MTRSTRVRRFSYRGTFRMYPHLVSESFHLITFAVLAMQRTALDASSGMSSARLFATTGTDKRRFRRRLRLCAALRSDDCFDVLIFSSDSPCSNSLSKLVQRNEQASLQSDHVLCRVAGNVSRERNLAQLLFRRLRGERTMNGHSRQRPTKS